MRLSKRRNVEATGDFIDKHLIIMIDRSIGGCDDDQWRSERRSHKDRRTGASLVSTTN